MRNLAAKLLGGLAKTKMRRRDLAASVGIGDPYLRLILRGVRLPRSPRLLADFAAALGLAESDLRAALVKDISEEEAARIARRGAEKS